MLVVHAQIEFFPKLVIRVPHNGLFNAQMKTLETIVHAEFEFFISILRVPHVSSIEV